MKAEAQEQALGAAADYMDRHPAAEPYYLLDEDGDYIIEEKTGKRMKVRFFVNQVV